MARPAQHGSHAGHRGCVNVAIARTIVADVGRPVLHNDYRRLESDHDDIISRASLRVLEAECLVVPPGRDELDFVRGTATKRVQWLTREFIKSGARGEWGVSCDVVSPPSGVLCDEVGLDQDGDEPVIVVLSCSAEDEALAVLVVTERIERERDRLRADADTWRRTRHTPPPRLAWGKASRRELFEAVFRERLIALADSAVERSLWRDGDRRLVAWRGLALADPGTYGTCGPERPAKGTLSAVAEQDLYGAAPRLAARLVAALDEVFQRHAGSVAPRPLRPVLLA